jgi:hypothetical protein
MAKSPETGVLPRQSVDLLRMIDSDVRISLAMKNSARPGQKSGGTGGGESEKSAGEEEEKTKGQVTGRSRRENMLGDVLTTATRPLPSWFCPCSCRGCRPRLEQKQKNDPRWVLMVVFLAWPGVLGSR